MSHLKTTRPLAALRAGRNDWYRISTRADADVAVVDIYDEIGYFGITAQSFVRDLRAINAAEIELHLNTPGGDTWDGIAIYNGLRDHPASVTVIVDGLAASAGSFIAQAGDRVVMNRSSEMMIHDAWGFCIGNAADMTEMVALLDRISGDVAGIYADRAGGTADEWRAAMKAETWYTADEAVAAGLADEVNGAGDGDAKNSFDLSIYSYAGRAGAPAPVIPTSAPAPAAADPDLAVITSGLKEAFA
ncbi:ATP-dependent protease ClpP, protease subunit [Jiangella alkaliphila]|uniref:ATP-dependent Clp protease proteolytic subunit n=2 Tax=Jiangella alkaliphila TaxID=419479 RepID=A0A1H2IF60_9ACTN|nr:ATP-dependent protease ClpP, protease subunit [Jiangella alkaliphila]